MNENSSAIPSYVEAQSLASVLYRAAGEAGTSVQDILDAHPEIAHYPSIMVDLAVEEFFQRTDNGEELIPQEFANQFPSVKRRILRVIGFHERNKHKPKLTNIVDPHAPSVGDTIGRYHLFEKLGEGASAQVYLAENQSIGGRFEVVKISSVATQEAHALGKLSHPGIGPVHHAELDAPTGLAVLSLPYLTRATLSDVIDKEFARPNEQKSLRDILEEINCPKPRPQPAESNILDRNENYADSILDMAVSLCDAVIHCHERGVVHGDIKPNNILVTPSGRAVLIDFNLSLIANVASHFGGTLPYMAPEQLEALRNVGHDSLKQPTCTKATDTYSLAVTIYEALTGKHPFGHFEPSRELDSELIEQMLKRRLEGPIPLREWSPNVSPGFAEIIERALSFTRSARTLSVRAFQSDLKKLRDTRAPNRSFKNGYIGTAATVFVAICAFLIVSPRYLSPTHPSPSSPTHSDPLESPGPIEQPKPQDSVISDPRPPTPTLLTASYLSIAVMTAVGILGFLYYYRYLGRPRESLEPTVSKEPVETSSHTGLITATNEPYSESKPVDSDIQKKVIAILKRRGFAQNEL